MSQEFKLVPTYQLKKWHRDLDACQKVIWLSGGFDPAYCKDAQECLQQMDVIIEAPVTPTGGEVEVQRWQLKGFIPGIEGVSPAVFKPWVVLASEFYFHVTRLQAELAQMTTFRDNAESHMRRIRGECTATEKELESLKAEVERLQSECFESLYNSAIDERDALKAKVERLKDNVRWKSVADQQMQAISGLQAKLTNAQELLTKGSHYGPYPWNQQVMDFLTRTCLAHQSAPADVLVVPLTGPDEWLNELRSQSAPAAKGGE